MLATCIGLTLPNSWGAKPLEMTGFSDKKVNKGPKKEKLAENGVRISFSQEFEDYMSTKGYEPAYGARPVKRLMQKELVNMLAKSILDGHVHRDSTIVVDVRDGQITVSDKG